MRISLLQKREDFNQIFCDTISDYWSEQSSEVITVTLKKSSDYSELLYAHKYFNFIACKNTSTKAFGALKKEYSNNASFLKRHLLRFYFSCSIHPVTLAFLSHQKFYVVPQIPEKETFLFIGGNTRLRIIYPDKDQTVVLLKKGFDKSYIENEISFRNKYNLKIAPKFIDYSFEKKSFTEAYTPGIPINRLQSTTNKLQFRQEAMQALIEQVITPTITTQEIKTYTNRLLSTVEELKRDIEDTYIVKEISNLSTLLKRSLHQFSGEIKLAFAHGDFQEANIILTDDGVKIIDWETVGERSVTYDFFTMLLKVREGIPKSKELDKYDSFYIYINKLIKDDIKVDLSIEFERYIIIFFLEELVYLLKSSCSPAFYKNGIGLFSKLSVMKNNLTLFIL